MQNTAAADDTEKTKGPRPQFSASTYAFYGEELKYKTRGAA